mmetsp:Transcript_32936/g.80093  ORF Transcript_32936/g.80093 Transcript_32936/m.80093 type:complete len:149 (+) Transcript_32936:61-507(+)
MGFLYGEPKIFQGPDKTWRFMFQYVSEERHMGKRRHAKRKDSRRFERMHQAVKAMKEEMEKMNINYEASSFVIPKRKRRKSICGPSRRQKKETKEIRAQAWSEKMKPKRKSMIEEKLEDANSSISTLLNALERDKTYTRQDLHTVNRR